MTPPLTLARPHRQPSLGRSRRKMSVLSCFGSAKASEIASGSKLGIDATKKLPGEGFKRPWPPLIKMDAAVKAKVEKLFGAVAKPASNPK